MKKLNNKGFAISTMIYGILTIIIIILMSLLSIMRSSYNKKNAANDEIYQYLNKCTKKQVQLEKCYKMYVNQQDNFSCLEQYEKYTLCAGTNINTNLNRQYLNTVLKNKVENKENNIINDPNNKNRYIFIGDNPNNYIEIGNLTGRIISVETNGTIKVILNDNIISDFGISYNINVTAKDRWKNSTIYTNFEKKYKDFNNKNYFVEGDFNLLVFYENDNDIIKKLTTTTDHFASMFGLPTLSDYIYASGNHLNNTNLCYNENSNNKTLALFEKCSQKNWMAKETCSWTSNGDRNNNYIIYNKNGVSFKNSDDAASQECNKNMVIYLTNKTLLQGGEGTKEKPYIIELG